MQKAGGRGQKAEGRGAGEMRDGPDMMRLRRHGLRVINVVIRLDEERSTVRGFGCSGVPTEGERPNHRTPELSNAVG